MLEHGLTTLDIEARAKLTREAGHPAAGRSGKGKIATGVKKKGVPKYRHPKTGTTWSGHGRAPAWIAGAKDRTKFLIAPDVDVAVSESDKGKTTAAAKKSTIAKRSAAKKGQPKGPQTALYRDPESDATWSGRGRAPAWLGADCSKFLVDGRVSEAKETNSAAAAKSKGAQAKNAVIKKGTAKKVVAKKAVARKASGRKVGGKSSVPAADVAPALETSTT
jgi:DNA-binding protein H-NS